MESWRGGGGPRGGARCRPLSFVSLSILAPALHVFFLSLIPALAFAQQMQVDTGGAVGTAQVLLSTSIFGVVQAVAGGQPLLIVGVAEPVVVVYTFMHVFAARVGIDFLAWAAWVALFAAAALAVLAAAGAASYVSQFTRFAGGDTFGAIVAALFVHAGVRIGASLFAPASPGADAGWAAADGAWSLFLASGVCCTALGLRSARSWRMGTAAVRGAVADYGAPAAVVLWTALSYAILSVHPPATVSIPRRLSVAPPWADTSFWRTAARMAAVPGWAVAAALPPAAIVAVLFYFDHSVSAQVALEVVRDAEGAGKTGKGKPDAYSLDLFILAATTLAAGLLGLPPTNGVLPQAPMHAHALAAAAGAADAAAERKAARRAGRQGASGEAEPPPGLDLFISPPRPLETRLAALLQALAVGAAAFAAPALATIPLGIIAGYFVFMAIEWVQPSQGVGVVRGVVRGAGAVRCARPTPSSLLSRPPRRLARHRRRRPRRRRRRAGRRPLAGGVGRGDRAVHSFAGFCRRLGLRPHLRPLRRRRLPAPHHAPGAAAAQADAALVRGGGFGEARRERGRRGRGGGRGGRLIISRSAAHGLL